MLRILGIDPGFGRMGYGVIEKKGSDWVHVAHGLVETSSKDSFLERLLEIHTDLKKIIRRYKPDLAAVEELFFAKNVKTAMQVGHARGVILLTAHEAGLTLTEVKPQVVKQAMTGYGRAEKHQVQTMVQFMLKLPKGKLQDDAADALAIALTAAAVYRAPRRVDK